MDERDFNITSLERVGVPDRCRDCPILEGVLKSIDENYRIINEAMGTILDPNERSRLKQKLQGFALGLGGEDEEAKKFAEEIDRTVRETILSDVASLDRRVKNVSKTVDGCPGTATMRAIARNVEILATFCMNHNWGDLSGDGRRHTEPVSVIRRSL